MHHPGVHIDADMQFDAVPSASLSCDTDVVPGAALMGAESGAVNRDGHLLFTEEPGDQVHRFPDVFDGEAGHASMDDAVSGKHWARCSDAVAVLSCGLRCRRRSDSDLPSGGIRLRRFWDRVLYVLFFSAARVVAADILL